jgi:hypothetical protein
MNNRSSTIGGIVCAIAIVFLAACGQENESSHKTSSDLQNDAEQELLADPARALPELIKRLRAAVSKREGLLVVQSPLSLEVAVLPPNTPWVLVCGAGIGLHLGSAVAEHDGSVAVADVLDVPLALPVRILTREECIPVMLALGREVLSIVGEK